jgi:2-dehydro-3-deoxy-D-arabinonate dehydratase
MKLYRTTKGILVHDVADWFFLQEPWDLCLNRPDLRSHLTAAKKQSGLLAAEDATEILNGQLLPPIGQQEVWAAGVTYLRSKTARMEESQVSGGADFYDKVYQAERPELFFKAIAQRVSGHGQEVYIRRDSAWNVPEPELTLFLNDRGRIVGYSIGNDMSSRSIEGENPLYLPQAKMYERSAALGPCLLVPAQPLPPDTRIEMNIWRGNEQQYSDSVAISQMKREHGELAEYLFRECDFPMGCFLMTGTCLVPPPDFSLQPGDRVDIRIAPIGVLSNVVAKKPDRKPKG